MKNPFSEEDIDTAVIKFTNFVNQHNFGVEILNVDDENVYIDFPRETPDISYPHQKFIDYSKELINIVFSIKNVRANSISQYPVFSNDHIDSLLERIKFKFENDEYSIEIIHNPLLIGLANVKYSYYSKYFPPCSTYHALEIRYKNGQVIKEEDELKIIKAFVFEYYQATNVLIEITELYDADADYYGDYDDEEENNLKQKEIYVNELCEYNDAMESYLKAADNVDADIKFLYYYKIIEYYSPKVSKLKGYELLSRKLDTLKYKNVDNNDLSKIFEISDLFRKSKSDNELAKTVLSVSIDIIDLFPLLPKGVAKIITQNMKINPKDINYDLEQERIDSLIQQLGKILYSTRNNIVHAKSNYITDGFECKDEDINDLNKFLSKATFQIITWANKLPKHSK